ncbi:hypothetical protein ACN28S_62460 [Cystobacter fuscus]
MKLRMRLALTTVVVAIPVALCMGWIHRSSRRAPWRPPCPSTPSRT